MMRNLSALGDTALLAPASAALFLLLLAMRRPVEARAFLAALVLGLGATLASKLLLRACGGFIDVVDLNSPSGHASFSTLFYGSLALMFAWARPRGVGIGLAGGAALLLVAIGASRPLQGVHSWAEVVLGWVIGLAGLAAFARLRRGADPAPLSPLPLAGGFAAAVLVFGGMHFTPERYIARLAQAASTSLDICRVTEVTALQPDLAALRR